MKLSIKPIYILLFALSLSLIWGDCVYIESSFSDNHEKSHRECADNFGHSEHSHNHCFEDYMLVSDSKVKSGKSSGDIESLPDFCVSLSSSFTANIWQPPKSC